jgi:trimethylamine--corrinoid protein Co-methyltransferase
MDAAVASRRGGRASRRELRTSRRETMLPALRRRLPPVVPLRPEQVQRIHEASLKVLEEVGIDFRDPVALADWRRAGGDVRDQRVRIERGLLTDLIASVPEQFTLHARDPAKSVEVGEEATIFVPMTGAPFIRGLDDERPTIDQALEEELKDFVARREREIPSEAT